MGLDIKDIKNGSNNYVFLVPELEAQLEPPYRCQGLTGKTRKSDINGPLLGSPLLRASHCLIAPWDIFQSLGYFSSNMEVVLT